jgi:hypothetical protein
MEKILQEIKKRNPKLSETSLNAYASSLRQLQRTIGADLSIEEFENPKDIFELMEAQRYTKNTFKNKLAAIIAFLKASDAPSELLAAYNEKIKTLKSDIDSFNSQMKLSTKDDKNWMKYDELVRVAEQSQKNLPKTISNTDELLQWEKAIVLNFHTVYPLRNELADAKLVMVPKSKTFESFEVCKKTECADDNYVILNPGAKWGYVVLRRYKTKKTYGDITFQLEPKLLPLFFKYAKLLTAFKKSMDITHDWLLMNPNYEKLSRNDFTRFVNSIFKDTHKNIGTTLIRKIVASHFYEGKGRELKDLAHVMGHSTDTALEYYAKDIKD